THHGHGNARAKPLEKEAGGNFRMRALYIQTIAMLIVVGLGAGSARADDSGRIIINTDIKAKKGTYPIAVPMPPTGDSQLAQMVTEVQTFDLNVSSWFKVLDPKSFLADLRAEDMSIEPQRWASVGASGVIKTKVSVSSGAATLEFKLYEVEKGAVP